MLCFLPPVILDDLLAKRLIVLSGKGGVGKSLVAAVLGLTASRRGKRTLLVEVDSPTELARFFDVSPVGHRETQVVNRLFAINLNPARVMDEYVKHVVKLDMLARRILESPIYHRFFAAAPGLEDLMVLGKVMTLEEAHDGFSRRPRYDLVILDAPATGHGFYLLKTPQAALRVAPLGPIGSNARRILKLLRDKRKTAVSLVAIPEEMAAAEASELAKKLEGDLGIVPAVVFLNACHERRFTPDQEKQVLALLGSGANGRLAHDVGLRGVLRAARHHIRRRRLTEFYRRRLGRAVGAPLLALPFLHDPTIGPASLERLAVRLEESG